MPSPPVGGGDIVFSGRPAGRPAVRGPSIRSCDAILGICNETCLPVSTCMGDRARVQFPVTDIYFSM